MEWALAIIFSLAAVLLCVSLWMMRKDSSDQREQIDMYFVSMLEENRRLQEQLRKVELDGHITVQQTNALPMDSKERELLRELLDLALRGYSVRTMAEKTGLKEGEINGLLAPYTSARRRDSDVSNVG